MAILRCCNNFFLTEYGRKGNVTSKRSSSDKSKISVRNMQLSIEKLKSKQTRESTKMNYLGIWHQFNNFVMRLDICPKKWEDLAVLFCVHLVEQGLQSSTIRSYLSATKGGPQG